MAVTALSRVYIGPPKAPACWPVRMATVAGRSGAPRPREPPAARCVAPAGRRSRRNRAPGCVHAPGRGRSRQATPRARRVAGVERGHAREIVGVLARQRTNPGKTPDIHARAPGAFSNRTAPPSAPFAARWARRTQLAYSLRAFESMSRQPARIGRAPRHLGSRPTRHWIGTGRVLSAVPAGQCGDSDPSVVDVDRPGTLRSAVRARK